MDGATSDDAWGRQTVFTATPLAAVEEVAILTNSFSPAYGRTSGGVLSVNTRAGTNDWSGEALALFRPGGLQARQPGAIERTEDVLAQGSGMISGPIARNKTHFLLSSEINRQGRDSVVTSPLAPQLYRGDAAQELALARIDHQQSEGSRFFGRFALDRLNDTNPGDAVGGLALPSAARVFERATYGLLFGHTAVISSTVVNEARVQGQLAAPIVKFDPVTPSTQYVRPGLATEGESRSADQKSRQAQLSDTLSIARGRHQWKFGADLIQSWAGGYGQEFGGGYVLGQFTLKPGVTKPISSLSPPDVQTFVQSFGNASYHVSQSLVGAFAEDNWRVLPSLSLTLGLRYDVQTFTDDHNMWSPRIGLAWNPRGNSRTVLRAGYGMYYSQLRANLAAGYRINGPEGIFTFSASPGQLGFPDNMQPLPEVPTGAAIPPRDITVRPGDREYLSQFFDVSKLRRFPDAMLNPRTQSFTAGFERDLGRGWIVSLDGVHQITSRIDRPLDLNAPAAFMRTVAGQTRSAAAADLTRPIRPVAGGYRRIIAVLNDGLARYDALQVNASKRFSRRAGARLSYTWSRAFNTVEPDVPGQDPNDAAFLGRTERGPSILDQPHRAVLSGWYQLPQHFTVGTVSFLAYARPFAVTTGVDNNGDRANSDRPVIDGALLGRNYVRGTPLYDVEV